MVRLLILTCGTNANFHFAKTLKEKFPGKFFIIGTDINRLWEIPSAPYIDKFYQSPFTSDEGYYQFVLNICKTESINFILPSFDADQQLFYDGNEDLLSLGVKSLGICKNILPIYKSKDSMNTYLQEHGFPVPKTYKMSEISPAIYYFVKPLHGVGSIDARKMLGNEITAEIWEANIIEEICSEPEVTLECFNYHNEIYTVARLRIAQKSGVCIKAKVYYDDELTCIARRFATDLQLPYIFNLQFMKNSEGMRVITDVNLRTAGGMSLSYAAGWDEVSALAIVMLDGSIENVVKHVQPVSPQYVMRAYTDIVTKKVKRRIAFDLDGTLLDSRLRHKVVMDVVLKDFGLYIDTNNLVTYKSEGRNNLSWLQVCGIEKKLASLIQKRWIELIEHPKYLVYDELYPNMLSILKSLSQENDLYILTARNNEESARRQIKSLGIQQYFEDLFVVISDNNTPQRKAEVLMNYEIDEYIGDTESDLKAAEIAGCRFKAVVDGFRSRNFWDKYNVEYL